MNSGLRARRGVWPGGCGRGDADAARLNAAQDRKPEDRTPEGV